MLNDFDMSSIMDLDKARDALGKLLNFIEALKQENQELKSLNQQLRDELHRLKGEQGKPPIKANTKTSGKNYSSEKERKKGTSEKKGGRRTASKPIINASAR